jgi:hypothetical protein
VKKPIDAAEGISDNPPRLEEACFLKRPEWAVGKCFENENNASGFLLCFSLL